MDKAVSRSHWPKDNRELESMRTKARVSVKLGGSSSGQKQFILGFTDVGV